MSEPMDEKAFVNLSDEDFMNMAEAPEVRSEVSDETDEPQVEESEAEVETDVDTSDATEEEPDQDPDESADEADEETTQETEEVDDYDFNVSDEEFGKVDPSGKPAEKPKDKAEKEPTEDTKKKDESSSDDTETEGKPEDKGKESQIDFEAAYKLITTPFKAAGKMIQIQSPEEAVQLMQMGAHYTKKMQAIQPGLKMLRMLENNDLMDEGKLSYLIDLSRKDPAAIQKLVKDSGIDPLDIDTNQEPTYSPGNHQVTDEEMNFQTAISDVAADTEGKELIIDINKNWDATSKNALWEKPDLLRVLSGQKQNGIFDQISAEVDRRKTLGYFRDEPFLVAYQKVGEEMNAQGQLTPKPALGSEPNQGLTAQNAPAQESQPETQRRVVETRPAKPKTIQNNDKARAASATKSTPSKKKPDFNPLAMSDEEFEKHASLGSRY